ncbi:MAG: tetratricopeptide repeat protein [Bacteroidota bacterium]
MENNIKSLKISDQSGDKRAVSNSYNNIGNIYINTGNQEKALENYLKSLHIKQQIFSESPDDIVNKKGIGNVYNNIGLIYMNTANYKKALENYMAALEIRERTGDKLGLASSYNNIGLLYFAFSDYEKALMNQQKSLKISEEIGDEQGIAASYLNIGSIYTKQNIFDKSYQYLNNSLTLFKKAGDINSSKEAYAVLSELNEKKGDYKKAFDYHQLFSNLKDSIFNEQSSKQIAEMNTKYDSEKKDNELIKKDAEISKQQAETEKQNLQRNAFIIGFVLVLGLAFFIYRSFRQKQSVNKSLEAKNKLIEKQKQLVNEKNEKITDSIQYAQRIQQAILPSSELINFVLPDSFIFFQPKDIVSGDFYWLSEKSDKLLIAIADCTGHGVPGAFMSMIGNTLLNEIVNVKNITKPDQILNELNKSIVNLLQQNNNESIQDDGMDLTIVAIDKTANQIEFAGANHFSYYIHQNELTPLEGDIYSIGGALGKTDINFTCQKLNITKGDTLYLFTDGYIDQFGGEKNTKFLTGRFSKLLHDVQQQDMKQQKESLKTAFDNWKGNNKQLDDVLVMGIKF